MRRPRQLNYANVMSTIAVFVALGGASYAIVSIPNNSVGTKQVKDRSLGTIDLSRKAVSSLRGHAGARGATGATGATGLAGANGTNGTNGAKGDKGDTGPAGATWATSVVAQQQNITTGASLPIADGVVTFVPSVTVTVPSSGLIEFYARAHIENDANGDTQLGLLVDGAAPGEACFLGGLLILTTASAKGDFATTDASCGARVRDGNNQSTNSLVSPLVIAVAPGTHTFKLAYGIEHTGGADTTVKVSDQRLAVAALG